MLYYRHCHSFTANHTGCYPTVRDIKCGLLICFTEGTVPAYLTMFLFHHWIFDLLARCRDPSVNQSDGNRRPGGGSCSDIQLHPSTFTSPSVSRWNQTTSNWQFCITYLLGTLRYPTQPNTQPKQTNSEFLFHNTKGRIVYIFCHSIGKSIIHTSFAFSTSSLSELQSHRSFSPLSPSSTLQTTSASASALLSTSCVLSYIQCHDLECVDTVYSRYHLACWIISILTI